MLWVKFCESSRMCSRLSTVCCGAVLSFLKSGRSLRTVARFFTLITFVHNPAVALEVAIQLPKVTKYQASLSAKIYRHLFRDEVRVSV